MKQKRKVLVIISILVVLLVGVVFIVSLNKGNSDNPIDNETSINEEVNSAIVENSNSSSETSEESTESSSEETISSDEEDSIETTPEVNTEDVSDNSEVATTPESDTRMEEGMEKVHKVVEVYNTLIDDGYELNYYAQIDCEKMTDDTFGLDYYYLANGEDLYTSFGIYSMCMRYYDVCVNDGEKPYNMADWLKIQPDEDAVIYGYLDIDVDNTNDAIMLEAIGLAPYLNNCKSIVGTELIETEDYIISGKISKYAIKLNCDGNIGLTAVFDENDRLLNICSSDDFEDYMYTVN